MPTPTHLWPYGTEYVVVLAVTPRTSQGVPDPSINERWILPHEAGPYIAYLRQQNPDLSAWVVRSGIWRKEDHAG